jgi:hypothetical protein
MTVKAINDRLEVEKTIHDAARQIVELIAATKERVAKLRGGEDGAAKPNRGRSQTQAGHSGIIPMKFRSGAI